MFCFFNFEIEKRKERKKVMLLRGKETIRWGILGCGDVCEVKSGPGFQKAEGSALVAVQRRTPGLAKDFAGGHGVAKFYTDVDALLDDPEVDAVYVATPPSSHKELAMKALKEGSLRSLKNQWRAMRKRRGRSARHLKKRECHSSLHTTDVAKKRFKIVRAKVVAGVIGAPHWHALHDVEKAHAVEAGAAPLPWRLEPR